MHLTPPAPHGLQGAGTQATAGMHRAAKDKPLQLLVIFQLWGRTGSMLPQEKECSRRNAQSFQSQGGSVVRAGDSCCSSCPQDVCSSTVVVSNTCAHQDPRTQSRVYQHHGVQPHNVHQHAYVPAICVYRHVHSVTHACTKTSVQEYVISTTVVNICAPIPWLPKVCVHHHHSVQHVCTGSHTSFQ